MFLYGGEKLRGVFSKAQHSGVGSKVVLRVKLIVSGFDIEQDMQKASVNACQSILFCLYMFCKLFIASEGIQFIVDAFAHIRRNILILKKRDIAIFFKEQAVV